jgi:hypothetical protein
MAAVSNGRSAMDPQLETQNVVVDRLKRLYPAVNEDKSPLPRAWSPKEKYNYIGLSQNNLRVHYKGKSFQGSLRELNGLSRSEFFPARRAWRRFQRIPSVMTCVYQIDQNNALRTPTSTFRYFCRRGHLYRFCRFLPPSG